jgi:hypothetical protein
VAERLAASQEGLRSMELLTYLLIGMLYPLFYMMLKSRFMNFSLFDTSFMFVSRLAYPFNPEDGGDMFPTIIGYFHRTTRSNKKPG